MIGDVIGKPGRSAIKELVEPLRSELSLDFVIANGENAAGGYGITLDIVHELQNCGVDVITSGNHIWDQKEIIPYMDSGIPLIRPANYPDAPGSGCFVTGDLLVVNLMGRVFMPALDCPFRTVDRVLEEMTKDRSYKAIVVDFHAEATSEKQGMGWYLDGRVSAVVGTHTHVGTVDARVLTDGTGFVTDVGMTGPVNSVIGSDIESVLGRFLSGMPRRLAVAAGPVMMNSVLIEVDDYGKAKSVERIDRKVE